MVILFLDFDGVLHPILSSHEKQFSQLSLFEGTIRQYDSIEIVISSNWRYQYTFDELQAFFSVDIQRKIVGCTRDVMQSKAKSRYAEIIDYLTYTHQMHSLWIALDDAKSEFPENLPNYIYCKPRVGFDENAASVLATLLKK